METSYIDYRDTGAFSQTLLAYLDRDPRLAPFIGDWPDLAAFGRQIERKQQTGTDRDTLVRRLRAQYDGLLEATPEVAENIHALADQKTFTITTGHQLNIFTGPLYFIFKIATTIRLARDLQQAYPDHRFVPVYWMATEDHDFEEINHTYLLGEKIVWDVEGVGATGRMKTETIARAVRTYRKMLGLSDHSATLGEMIEKAYLAHSNLADATRFLVNALFGRYGLVIVDADDGALKKNFSDVMREDILQGHSHRQVQTASRQLEAEGFTVQVNDRPINFFYLTDEFRERIVFENGRYQILNRDIGFTERELIHEIERHPERFSPNVIMRPFYQELILPNLAYIGGGAEIVYWMQLKGVFDHYQLPFPILIPRNSAMVTDRTAAAKLTRFDLSFTDVFRPLAELQNTYVRNHSTQRLDLREEWTELNTILDAVRARAEAIDPTLGPSAEAVRARVERAFTRLEKKMLRAGKRQHEDALGQLARLKEKLFPGGGLQERTENFGLLYVKYGPALMETLIQHFRPLDFKFTIFAPQCSRKPEGLS